MITQKCTKTLSGAKIILETLKNLGVDTIFGYPGGIVLDVYDELYKQNNIKHILLRHEQSAVHAAEGYARATGKCGVVLVTSGPGATNTITGITNAYLDGYPLLVLTGQVCSNLIGKNAFQEANICSIAKSCSKQTFQVTNGEDLQNILTKAYTIAMSGKKGPVVVDMAKNIFSQNIEFQNNIIDIPQRPNIHSSKLNSICEKIKKSERPLLIIGGGVNHSQSYKDLEKFLEITKIPFVSTMMGLGSFSTKDKNYFGMLGIYGDNSANEIFKNADLIISLGARLNDRISSKFNATELNNKIIQIDINEKEIGNFYIPIEYAITEIKTFLTEINQLFTCDVNFEQWAQEAQRYKENNTIYTRTTNLRHSFEVIKALEDATKDKNVIFTTEVGQHQLWAVKNLNFDKNRKIFVSGGSGTMGFGLPAAIGASIANPKQTVVCIAGDGSAQMSMGELAACKDYNLDIKLIILNNGYLGMVRQLQESSCQGRYSQTKISNPNYENIAHAYDIGYYKVKASDNLAEIYTQAFSSTGTCIIDVEIEPIENV